jgi:hypothetical protein
MVVHYTNHAAFLRVESMHRDSGVSAAALRYEYIQICLV